jgi:hypothetical protein
MMILGKLTDGERPLALAGGTEAIHDLAEPGQIADLCWPEWLPAGLGGMRAAGMTDRT